MPTIRKGQTYYTLEEMEAMLKADIRKNAAEIPELLAQKQLEYV